MFNNNRILGIIPARGGSKGLPQKNIKLLLDKPLIVWTIETALKSKYLDRVVVSTDDEKIAKISKKNGAEVPFIRPKELATDDAKGIDVIIHSIRWFQNRGINFDIVILLQPTSPLRETEDIDRSIEYFFKKNADAVVSVCVAEHSPLWINTLPYDMNMKNFLKKDIINKNRQELPVFYRLNGAIYIAYIGFLLKNKSFFGPKTFAFIMNKWSSIDIDDEFDFFITKCIMNYKK